MVITEENARRDVSEMSAPEKHGGLCQSIDALRPRRWDGVRSFCCFAKFWKNRVREADFGGFRLFAHTIFGGENFRVGADLEVYNSKIRFHITYETEESSFLRA